MLKEGNMTSLAPPGRARIETREFGLLSFDRLVARPTGAGAD